MQITLAWLFGGNVIKKKKTGQMFNKDKPVQVIRPHG